MTLYYVYGITNGTAKTPSLTAFGTLESIAFKDVSAIVSPVPESEWSQDKVNQNVKHMKWLAEKVPIHEQVVERVMEDETIIPLTFCTIFNSIDHVKVFLEENYATFQENLSRLQGKVEFGVKAYFNPEVMIKSVSEKSEKVSALNKEASGMSEGTAYFTKKKADTLAKSLVQEELTRVAKDIFESVREFTDDSKSNELLKKSATGRDMLLNAVFLIRKERAQLFKEHVQKISTTHPDLTLDIPGPFPPYNFVERGA